MFKSSEGNFVSRMVVDSATWQMKEINSLYAIKNKKEDSSKLIDTELSQSLSSDLSIADFISIVKDYL